MTILTHLKKMLLSFLFLALLASCGEKKENQSTVVIKKTGNVTHVLNPIQPKMATLKLNLKEELSIGNDTDDDYMLLKTKNLAVDNNGNIYVADRIKCRIHVFDKTGLFIRYIGSKGEGPGENLDIIDLNIDERNDRIHILDIKSRKISRYDLNGTFISDLKLVEGIPVQFFVDPSGFYLVKFVLIDDNDNKKDKILKYTFDGQKLDQSLLLKSGETHRKKINGVIISFKTNFDPTSFFAFLPGKGLMNAFSDKYEIHVFDDLFQLNKILFKQEPEKIKVSDTEKNEIFLDIKEKYQKKGIPLTISDISFPDYRPVFSDFWVDDKERIFVRVNSTGILTHIDVFGADGVYLEQWLVNETSVGIKGDNTIFHNPIFKDDFVYSIVLDDNQVFKVKKYSFVEKRP